MPSRPASSGLGGGLLDVRDPRSAVALDCGTPPSTAGNARLPRAATAGSISSPFGGGSTISGGSLGAWQSVEEGALADPRQQKLAWLLAERQASRESKRRLGVALRESTTLEQQAHRRAGRAYVTADLLHSHLETIGARMDGTHSSLDGLSSPTGAEAVASSSTLASPSQGVLVRATAGATLPPPRHFRRTAGKARCGLRRGGVGWASAPSLADHGHGGVHSAHGHQHSGDDVERARRFRERIRAELIEKAGSALKAFKSLDLNGSGHISFQEFADGLTRLGVRWQDIMGTQKPRELFALFDRGKSYINFRRLFPGETPDRTRDLEDPDRFWDHYCRETDEAEHAQVEGQKRIPTWLAYDQDEEIRIHMEAGGKDIAAHLEKRAMSSTIRRLQTEGHSYGKCREIAARHLPHGTGPKDSDQTAAFTFGDSRACRKEYMERVNDSVKNIQKACMDFRERKKTLQNCRQRLWAEALDPSLRAGHDEDNQDEEDSSSSAC